MPVEMYEKALALNKELGRKEGMAIQYGNLGIVHETRGEVDRARDVWTKARNLFAEVGTPDRVEQVEAFLAELKEES